MLKTDLVGCTTDFANDFEDLKSYSSENEKDKLICNLLSSEDEQKTIEEVYFEWKVIPSKRKNSDDKLRKMIGNSFPKAEGVLSLGDLMLAYSVRDLSEESQVKIRKVGNLLEYWFICKEKDYSVLRKAVSVISEYSFCNKKEIDCIFTCFEDYNSDNGLDFIVEI